MAAKRNVNKDQFSLFTESGEPTPEAATKPQKVLNPEVEKRLQIIGLEIRRYSSRDDWRRGPAPYIELFDKYEQIHNQAYPEHPINRGEIDRMYG
jgi:hypothetical protein